jgi:hypothetical protein
MVMRDVLFRHLPPWERSMRPGRKTSERRCHMVMRDVLFRHLPPWEQPRVIVQGAGAAEGQTNPVLGNRIILL